MHIMEIVSGRLMNGAINHCLLLTRELVRRGNRVTLVCLPEAWISRQLAGEPVDVVFSDLHRWPTDELRRIAGIARDRQIDVVHTHLSRAHFFGILVRWFARVPTVATAHSRHFQLHWMFNDYVVAVSEATRRYHRLHNFVRSGRIETIRTFIDYHRMSAALPDVRARMRGSLGVDDSTHLIGCVGDVIPRKGLIHLVGALPKILAAVPQTRLVVVGRHKDPDYIARVKSTAGRLQVADAMILTGHRDDVDQIMAALDVCVLPSLEEPLGMSILEASAAGLPVVGSAVGGIPECIRDGVTGTLVRPANSDALAEAIVRLLEDPALRRQFGQAGRIRARDEFSAESQTPRLEEVFARVAQRKTAA